MSPHSNRLKELNPSFAKDKKTGAFVNHSKSDYDRFLINRRNKLEDQRRVTNLENEVSLLNRKLDQILDHLNPTTIN